MSNSVEGLSRDTRQTSSLQGQNVDSRKGHKVTSSQGYKVTGHKDTRSQGHGSQGHSTFLSKEQRHNAVTEGHVVINVKPLRYQD